MHATPAHPTTYSHAANRAAVVLALTPLLVGLLRQARGAGNSDDAVLERLVADETLRAKLARAIGRRHVFSAHTARDAWSAAREMARVS